MPDLRPAIHPEKGATTLTCASSISPLRHKQVMRTASASDYAPARRRIASELCIHSPHSKDGLRAIHTDAKKNAKKKGAAEATPFLPLSRNFEGHPNPVRIRMLSDASVKRTLCSLRFPPLDLSGAGFGYNRHYIHRSRVLQIRLTSSNKSLRPHCRRCRAPICSLTRCTQRFRVLFPVALASASSKAEALSFVRCVAKFTFIPLYRMAPECRLRLSHPFVSPVQPATRQIRQIVYRAAKYYQDTNFSVGVDYYFSTIFREALWGKSNREFSRTYCSFRKITEKLFAGISTMRSIASRFFCASGRISRSKSRTPHASLRAFRLASKASLEGAV